MESYLHPRTIGGASVIQTVNGWHFELPAGDHHAYRLAQVDDFSQVGRKNFLHRPPWEMSLRARVSAENLPGTWGVWPVE